MFIINKYKTYGCVRWYRRLSKDKGTANSMEELAEGLLRGTV